MVDLLNQVLTWRINPYHFLPLALLLLWLEEADDTHPVTNLLSAGHINHLPPGFESQEVFPKANCMEQIQFRLPR